MLVLVAGAGVSVASGVPVAVGVWVFARPGVAVAVDEAGSAGRARRVLLAAGLVRTDVARVALGID